MWNSLGSLLIAYNTTPFLPRDAMHKRGICRHAVSVRPSVCLSVRPYVCHVRELRQNE